MKKIIFLLVGTFVLSNCATTSQIETESGPTAKVRFTTNTGPVTGLYELTNQDCDKHKRITPLRNGILLVGKTRRLGMPLWDYHENAAKEFLVPANKTHFYLFHSAGNDGRYVRNCGTFVSQKFEENKDYEVSYKWNDHKCYVDVNEIKKNESGEFEKVLLQRKNSIIEPPFAKRCKAVFSRISTLGF